MLRKLVGTFHSSPKRRFKVWANCWFVKFAEEYDGLLFLELQAQKWRMLQNAPILIAAHACNDAR
jgi:hypothetical protein